MRIFDVNDVFDLFRSEVETSGYQRAWAKKAGVNRKRTSYAPVEAINDKTTAPEPRTVSRCGFEHIRGLFAPVPMTPFGDGQDSVLTVESAVSGAANDVCHRRASRIRD